MTPLYMRDLAKPMVRLQINNLDTLTNNQAMTDCVFSLDCTESVYASLRKLLCFVLTITQDDANTYLDKLWKSANHSTSGTASITAKDENVLIGLSFIENCLN